MAAIGHHMIQRFLLTIYLWKIPAMTKFGHVGPRPMLESETRREVRVKVFMTNLQAFLCQSVSWKLATLPTRWCYTRDRRSLRPGSLKVLKINNNEKIINGV